MNVVFTNFKVVLITKIIEIDMDRKDKIITYMYLTAVKHKHPDMYKLLLSGDFYLTDLNVVSGEETGHLLQTSYYNFNDTVMALVQLLKNKGAQHKISAFKISGGREYTDLRKMLIVDDYVDENVTVSRYIENTLEMIGER